jgi:hypothetical protein
MQRSEEIKELAAALAKAQSEFAPVPKNKVAKVKSQRTGAEFQYKYADLADVLSMAIPVLSRNGISFSQPHNIVDGKLRVQTMLLHLSGQWMMSDGLEISEAGDPQSFGAESTYFRRYDGCSFIGVAPDEDTDAQQHPKVGSQDAPKAKKSQTPPPEEPVTEGPAPTVNVRSQFFAEATKLGWGLAAIKSYMHKAYPEAKGSTANLAEGDLTQILEFFARVKPSEVDQ